LTERFELSHHSIKVLELTSDRFKIDWRKIHSLEQREPVGDLFSIVHSGSFNIFRRFEINGCENFYY
jgi:hypothetical protein